jgi:hypothetical protein
VRRNVVEGGIVNSMADVADNGCQVMLGEAVREIPTVKRQRNSLEIATESELSEEFSN